MNPTAVLHHLLNQQLAPAHFSHRHHVASAWAHLQSSGQPRLTSYAAALHQLATRAGSPQRYHATITGAFFCLIAHQCSGAETFDAFEQRCPHLFKSDCLTPYYSPERLALDDAQRRFLAPDRRPLPGTELMLGDTEPPF